MQTAHSANVRAKTAILAYPLTVGSIYHLIGGMKHFSLLTGFLLFVCGYCGAEPEKWLKAAEQGDAQAQLNLAYAYAKGKEVAQDPEKAFKYFKLTAEDGIDFAQYQVALCYAKGNGVAKNDQLAFAWLQKAAMQNVAPAQYALGLCYKHGKGTPVNDKAAFESFHDAALKGYAKAQLEMAKCYTEGTWIAKDAKLAQEWAEKARSEESLFSQQQWDERYELWPPKEGLITNH